MSIKPSGWRRVAAAAGLCAALSAAGPVRADETRPTANSPAAIRPVSDASTQAAAEEDAATAWAHQTIKRSGQSLHALSPDRRAESGTMRKVGSGVRQSALGTSDLFWPLAVVLLAIAGVTVVLRKLLPRTNRVGAGGVIEILASHYFSNKHSLCLVRLGRRAVLLGVTPERIAAVAEITDREEVAGIVSAIEVKRPSSFTSAFSRACGRDLVVKPANEVEERAELVKGERLARAGASVRELVGRIRSLSGERTSAEST